ncbi:succinate dehydrogenase/fumarate reductase iron-sulfur subunit [Candidatus Sumerlaeota bacterium]
MNLTLRIWRQDGPKQPGEFVTYQLEDIIGDMSFLEMLDILNEQLITKGELPVEFDHDCREGICGACGLYINGQAHGPEPGTTTCQLHMRSFNDGDTIVIEPWRAQAFPVIKDLVVDRDALDCTIAAGGFVSIRTGPHADANATLIPKDKAEKAMDAAACIGCGACVAACPNASSSLFTGAKITQLALLPQGHPERARRVTNMVEQMDGAGFGNCSNIGECAAACPKKIPLTVIARMKCEYLRALVVE